jgi:hypothetical protein
MRIRHVGGLLGGTLAAVWTYLGVRSGFALALKHEDVFESEVLFVSLFAASVAYLFGASLGWLLGRGGDWLLTKPQ